MSIPASKASKRPFQVGDRVLVASVYQRELSETKGTILSICPDDGRLTVECSETQAVFYAHPKQCRRLRPKVREKTVKITRSQLSEAWNANVPFDNFPRVQAKWKSFERLCRALGLSSADAAEGEEK